MKKITKLNDQLVVTLIVLILGGIIAFGMIVPRSISKAFDNRMYEMLLASQQYLDISDIENNNGREGIYHILYCEFNENIDRNLSEDILHQRLMYKSFFAQLDEMIAHQQKTIGKYKYVQGSEIIYYIINQVDPEHVIISYKIDVGDQNLSNQVFINILLISTITMAIILSIFFKWNKRLINNLKDVQLKLDAIGEGDLQNPIHTDHYTMEFQEVMYSLEHMRQRLYENEQIKQDMIHNISHDLKTPLSVIKNYAEGIIDGVYPYGTVEETALVIYNQSDRLYKRVQKLLYLNRLDYLKGQVEVTETFNMKELVAEVLGYMQDKEDGREIEVSLEETYFVGDIDKWRVVLENLLDNAKRYAISRIRIELKGKKLVIYNDGPHIDESMNGSLFKPFEVGKGGVTGLGLSIVKKSIELYEYQIKFINEPSGGVSFVIYKIT